MSAKKNDKAKRRKTQRHSMYEQSTFVATNKAAINASTHRVAHNLSKAMEILIYDGTVLDMPGLTTIATMTEDIFHALGTSILGINWKIPRPSEDYVGVLGIDWDQKDMRTFSLVGLENKNEGIDNPNIRDPDLKNLAPKLISANDKFIDRNDPIFEQDEEVSEVQKSILVKKRHLESLKLAPLVDSLCIFHMNIVPPAGGKSTYTINKYLNSKDKKAVAKRRRQ